MIPGLFYSANDQRVSKKELEKGGKKNMSRGKGEILDVAFALTLRRMEKARGNRGVTWVVRCSKKGRNAKFANDDRKTGVRKGGRKFLWESKIKKQRKKKERKTSPPPLRSYQGPESRVGGRKEKCQEGHERGRREREGGKGARIQKEDFWP